MTEFEERRWRLATACMMAGVQKTEVAQHIDRTLAALNQWERRGDGHRRGALTSEQIARAITELGKTACPAAALQAGSPFRPLWAYDAELGLGSE